MYHATWQRVVGQLRLGHRWHHSVAELSYRYSHGARASIYCSFQVHSGEYQ